MLQEGLAYVAALVRKGEKLQKFTHAGLTYADRQVTRIPDELPIPDVKPLTVATLSAVVAYITGKVDEVAESKGSLFVHVTGPTSVEVLTPALGESQKRQTWMVANALTPRLLVSDSVEAPKYVGISVLATHLRTCFQESEARDDLVKFLGVWVETDTIEIDDDGVTQNVVMRSGLTLNKEGKAPSLMDLAPIRTFHEVEQPTSPFVLRVEKGGNAALFTADGGAWRLEAVRAIAEFLRSELPKGVVVLD